MAVNLSCLWASSVTYDKEKGFLKQIWGLPGLFLLIAIVSAALSVWLVHTVRVLLPHGSVRATARALLMLGCEDLRQWSPSGSHIRGRIWILEPDRRRFVPLAFHPQLLADPDRDLPISLDVFDDLIMGEAFRSSVVVVKDLTKADRDRVPGSFRPFVPPDLQTVLAAPIGTPRTQEKNRLGVVTFDCNAATAQEWSKPHVKEIAANVAEVVRAMLTGETHEP